MASEPTSAGAGAVAAESGGATGGAKAPMQRQLSRHLEEAERAEHVSAANAAGFRVTRVELDPIAEDHDLASLERLGGVDGLLRGLQCDRLEGLPLDKVASSRQVFGANRLPTKRLRWFLEHLWESVQDLTLIILIVAATLTIIFGAAVSRTEQDVVQGGAILLAAVVVATVTSTVDYMQEREFASLSAANEDREVTVVRGGQTTRVSVYDVVVGDLFKVTAGEVLPCDGVLVQSNSVLTNQSALTGESEQIPKSVSKDPFLLGGSMVDAGSGVMVVTAVGADAAYGRIIAALASAETPPTPLQVKLDQMAQRIGYIGFGFGTMTFIALIIAWTAAGGHEDESDNRTWYQVILSFFVVAVTIVVVAVPEGLPLAVTISLAFSMRRMAKDQNLVRNLASCETMGSATAICSDKTGTLTQNRMTVLRGFFAGRMRAEAELAQLPEILGAEFGHELAESIALNTEATVRYHPPAPPEFLDNKTECALLLMLLKDLRVDYEAIRRANPVPHFRDPFSSDRKRMTSVFRRPDGSYAVFVKGAAEVLVSLCTSMRNPDAATNTAGGDSAALTDETRTLLRRYIDEMASTGLRTLAIAVGGFSEDQAPAPFGADDEVRDAAYRRALQEGTVLEKDLVLLAIVGIKDPIRPEVPRAVQQCKDAGVQVRMVTGDNILTAMHIARECGILEPSSSASPRAGAEGAGVDGGGGNTSDDSEDLEAQQQAMLSSDDKSQPRRRPKLTLCMEGRDYRTKDEAERRRIVQRLAVLARSIPSDKLMLVQDLQALGEVVAVTGDGSNDAPALKAANVGLAMGITGTEVAKEAADIIILDDNFKSIVTAIKWGRNVLESVQRFLAFQLVINVSALLLTFVVACANEGSTSAFPLTPVQLMFINLIMDSFAALGLATEPPTEALLFQAPNGPQKPLITRIMLKMILVQGVFQFLFLVWVVFHDEFAHGLFRVENWDAAGRREVLTNVYNTFVWMQLFNKINARRIHDEANILEDFFDSPFPVGILAIIVFMQILIISFGGTLMSTVPLSWDQWLINIALGALCIPVGYIIRFSPYFDADDHIAAREGAHRYFSNQHGAKPARIAVANQ